MPFLDHAILTPAFSFPSPPLTPFQPGRRGLLFGRRLVLGLGGRRCHPCRRQGQEGGEFEVFVVEFFSWRCERAWRKRRAAICSHARSPSCSYRCFLSLHAMKRWALSKSCGVVRKGERLTDASDNEREKAEPPGRRLRFFDACECFLFSIASFARY